MIKLTLAIDLWCDICNKQAEFTLEVPKGWRLQGMKPRENISIDDLIAKYGPPGYINAVDFKAVCPDCDPKELPEYKPKDWKIK